MGYTVSTEVMRGHRLRSTPVLQRDRVRYEIPEIFQEFVDDEALFVTFLEQLHARLNQSASLYDSIEEQNTARLTSIANKLDGQGG